MCQHSKNAFECVFCSALAGRLLPNAIAETPRTRTPAVRPRQPPGIRHPIRPAQHELGIAIVATMRRRSRRAFDWQHHRQCCSALACVECFRKRPLASVRSHSARTHTPTLTHRQHVCRVCRRMQHIDRMLSRVQWASEKLGVRVLGSSLALAPAQNARQAAVRFGVGGGGDSSNRRVRAR